MGKNIFEILKEMIQQDIDDATTTLGVCPDMVSCDKVKAGGHVKMGVPNDVFGKIVNNEVIPILLIINKKAYKEKGGKL